MSGLEILGTGWVTPIGRGDAAFDAIKRGDRPVASDCVNPLTDAVTKVFAVDQGLLADVDRLPRLRRAGSISAFAVAAARDALEAAGEDLDRDRLGLVFTTTNGGVIYTRRFFAEIAKSGAQAGSPLLFPETVYNAPGSHVAACLGIGGATATLVGDGASGLTAFAVASEMLDGGDCDCCLVVGAEEADWVTCAAYGAWSILSETGTIEPHSDQGTIFANGAAAVLVGPGNSRPRIGTIPTERRFSKIEEGVPMLRDVVSEIIGNSEPDAWVTSASGTRFDAVEAGFAGPTTRIDLKARIGESFAAAGVAQVVMASRLLQSDSELRRVLVTQVGLGSTIAALAVE